MLTLVDLLGFEAHADSCVEIALCTDLRATCWIGSQTISSLRLHNFQSCTLQKLPNILVQVLEERVCEFHDAKFKFMFCHFVSVESINA